MAMQLCEAHIKQLQAGFERENIDHLKATDQIDLHKRLAEKTITETSFEPYMLSAAMMLDVLSAFHNFPPEGLPYAQGINPCPACAVIEAGNPEVIDQCVQLCKQEAIRLGLAKSN